MIQLASQLSIIPLSQCSNKYIHTCIYSYFPKSIKEWNFLPENIVLTNSVSTFWNKLQL